MSSSNATDSTNNGGPAGQQVAEPAPKHFTIGDVHPDNDKYRGLTGDIGEQDVKQKYFEEDFKFVMPDHLRRPHQVNPRAAAPPASGAYDQGDLNSTAPYPSDLSTTQLDGSRSTVSESTARDKSVPGSDDDDGVKQSLAFRVAGKVDNLTGATQKVIKRRRTDDRKNGTICGMRRKVFWIVFIVASLVIIGLSVGLGVGLAVANDNDYYASYYDDGIANLGNISTSPEAVYLNTTLSSLNFTDEFGYDNIVVFYQLNSKVLCRSLWNSSDEKWTAAVVSNETLGIEKGSPLSSNLYWYNDDNGFEVRLYAVTEDRTLNGWISSSHTNGSVLEFWANSSIASFDAVPVGEGSSIVSNGNENFGTLALDMVAYQDHNGTMHLLLANGDTSAPVWAASVMPFEDYLPSWNTPMALTPVYQRGDPSLSLFYYSEFGYLRQVSIHSATDVTQVYGVADTGSSMRFYEGTPYTVLAAFTAGWNDTSDDLKVQVLGLDGLLYNYSYQNAWLMAYQYGQWAAKEYIPTMANNRNPMALTANQAGRVYGTIVQNTSVVIYEWMWEGGNSYKPIGVVNTTLPSG
ncbi:hypothetical protein VD0002_g6236 [Verticillium dahliae]|nr:Putative proline-specific permease put4 [Verticillium dahliae VDG2]PNH31325.1 hypothetical protein BJF96_g5494 [Verticillium dahliae]PNH57709.1 hypothetical protein VD0003_g170 [Verticillium dahliae]PNH61626.1 hypothetical protein VD0002_g6236 [Verticillium dahliae]